jgi:hypothetical protein
MTFAQQLREAEIAIEIAHRDLAIAKAARRAILAAKRQHEAPKPKRKKR